MAGEQIQLSSVGNSFNSNVGPIRLTNIAVSVSSATVTHDSTGSTIIAVGDTIKIEGMNVAAFNKEWTVVSVTNEFTFVFNPTESGRASPGNAQYSEVAYLTASHLWTVIGTPTASSFEFSPSRRTESLQPMERTLLR